jgi:hypothetical protein
MPYGKVKTGTHWLHIADGWTIEEKYEMIKYLKECTNSQAKQGE